MSKANGGSKEANQMSGGVNVEWHGAELLQAIQSEMEKRLDTVAEVVRAEAVRSIRTPYPPASLPGNPPHSRSGASGLFGSVTWKRESRFSRVVGSHLRYALFLELGTSRMKARPWLRPALAKSQKRIDAIMSKSLR